MVFENRQIWTSPLLPTLGAHGTEVLERSRRSDVHSRELQELLATDAPFSRRIIAAANSALFAHSSVEGSHGATSIETIPQVVEKLGIAGVTSLTLILAVSDTCLNHGHSDETVTSLWRRSVVKAVAAEVLCSQVREGLECEYLLAGLLLDIGRFTLLQTAHDDYLAVLQKSTQEILPLWRTEQTELGVTSAEVGAQLVEHWGFPTRLVHGIQIQFAPVTTFQQLAPSPECPLCSALALASAIGDYFCSDQPALSWFRMRELVKDIVPLSELELETILERVSRRFTAIADVMQAGKDLPGLASLKKRAIEQLKLINLQSPVSERAEPSTRTRRGVGQRGSNSGGLSSKAARDPLTLLHTREFFEEALQKEVQRCRHLAAPVGVAIVEINRFVELKAMHGDSFGDVVLKRAGGLLKDLLRSSDIVARCDDQFAILVSDPTAKGMQRLADRIRGRIATESLVWIGQPVPLTVCVGATLALPGRREEDLAPSILTAARKAVVEAMSDGDNHTYFDSLVNEVELQRLFMVNQFRFSRWLIAQDVLTIPCVARALLDFRQSHDSLGEIAVRQQLLSEQEIEQVLNEQAETQDRFGEITVRRDLLSEEQLVGLLILQQEDPLQVAEQFLCKGILEPKRLHALLKEYFDLIPWAAPLYPSTGNG